MPPKKKLKGGKAAKGAAKDVAKGVSKDTAKDAGKEVAKGVAKGAAKGVAKGVVKDTTKDATKAATKEANKTATIVVRDYDKPVRLETSRQIPLDCLLPYLAMGFTPQQTSGSGFRCGAYALAISYNAASAALRPLQPSSPSSSLPILAATDVEDIIAILSSDDYQAQADAYLAIHNPPSGNSAQDKQRRDEMFRKDWLDHMQLECVLAVLNGRFGTEFVLGLITGGWQGRLASVTDNTWEPKFLRLTEPTLPTGGEMISNRPVVWVNYDNVNAKGLSQRGPNEIRADHWEGFAPLPESDKSKADRIAAVQNYRVGALVDQDIHRGVSILLRNMAGDGAQHQLDARRGAFLRPATPGPGVPIRKRSVYMRACNGNVGYVSSFDIRDVEPHDTRPTAATDALIVKANANRIISVAQDPRTKNPATVGSKPSEAEIGALEQIRLSCMLNDTDLASNPPHGLLLVRGDYVLYSTTIFPSPGTPDNPAAWVIDIYGDSGHVWVRQLQKASPAYGLKDELYILRDYNSVHFDNTLDEVKAIATSLNIKITKKKFSEIILETNDAIAAINYRRYGLKMYRVDSDLSDLKVGANNLQSSKSLNKGDSVMRCAGGGVNQGNIRVRGSDGYESEISEKSLTLLTERAWGLRLGLVTGRGYPFLPAPNAKQNGGDGDEENGSDGGTGGDDNGATEDVEVGEDVEMGEDVENEEPAVQAKGKGKKRPLHGESSTAAAPPKKRITLPRRAKK